MLKIIGLLLTAVSMFVAQTPKQDKAFIRNDYEISNLLFKNEYIIPNVLVKDATGSLKFEVSDLTEKILAYSESILNDKEGTGLEVVKKWLSSENYYEFDPFYFRYCDPDLEIDTDFDANVPENFERQMKDDFYKLALIETYTFKEFTHIDILRCSLDHFMEYKSKVIDIMETCETDEFEASDVRDLFDSMSSLVYSFAYDVPEYLSFSHYYDLMHNVALDLVEQSINISNQKYAKDNKAALLRNVASYLAKELAVQPNVNLDLNYEATYDLAMTALEEYFEADPFNGDYYEDFIGCTIDDIYTYNEDEETYAEEIEAHYLDGIKDIYLIVDEFDRLGEVIEKDNSYFAAFLNNFGPLVYKILDVFEAYKNQDTPNILILGSECAYDFLGQEGETDGLRRTVVGGYDEPENILKKDIELHRETLLRDLDLVSEETLAKIDSFTEEAEVFYETFVSICEAYDDYDLTFDEVYEEFSYLKDSMRNFFGKIRDFATEKKIPVLEYAPLARISKTIDEISREIDQKINEMISRKIDLLDEEVCFVMGEISYYQEYYEELDSLYEDNIEYINVTADYSASMCEYFEFLIALLEGYSENVTEIFEDMLERSEENQQNAEKLLDDMKAYHANKIETALEQEITVLENVANDAKDFKTNNLKFKGDLDLCDAIFAELNRVEEKANAAKEEIGETDKITSILNKINSLRTTVSETKDAINAHHVTVIVLSIVLPVIGVALLVVLCFFLFKKKYSLKIEKR